MYHDVIHLELVKLGHTFNHIHQPLLFCGKPVFLQVDGGPGEGQLTWVTLRGKWNCPDEGYVQHLARLVHRLVAAVQGGPVKVKHRVTRLDSAVEVDPLYQVFQKFAEHELILCFPPKQTLHLLAGRKQCCYHLQLVLGLRPVCILPVIDIHYHERRIAEAIIRLLVYEHVLRKFPELSQDRYDTHRSLELIHVALLLTKKFGISHSFEPQPLTIKCK